MKKLSDVYTGTVYADEKVLASAPKHKRVGELEFFNLGRYATCAEVEAEYAKRGLVPAEVLALAGWDEEHKDDPRKCFATQWRDADGNFCYASFRRWLDERFVRVYRSGDVWNVDWWFSGLRLVPASTGGLVAKHLHSGSEGLELPSELVINGITYRKI